MPSDIIQSLFRICFDGIRDVRLFLRNVRRLELEFFTLPPRF